ncbi:MAG: shikimate kinase [Candidatus Dormibacteraeota bacterium]|nr:shikimate kinase [Candidatus Dormibacteraeota bacterium]
MGSGKTTVGGLVAELARTSHCDLDSLIEECAGMSVSEVFKTAGEGRFRALESSLLGSALEPGVVVSLGGGTPMEEANWALLQAMALTVFLDAPLETLLARVGGGEGRPLLAGGGSGAAARLLDARLPRYRQADHIVNAARPAPDVAQEVVALWRR